MSYWYVPRPPVPRSRAQRFIPSTTHSTSVAEISLAAGNDPADDTNHVIKARARVQSGVGTLYVALYEGSNNRSGDLSQVLTTSLADYSFAIPQASAANITSYADLSIRFWGAGADGATVFEIDQLWLETPAVGPQTVTVTAAQARTATPVAPTRVAQTNATITAALAATATPVAPAIKQSVAPALVSRTATPVTPTRAVQTNLSPAAIAQTATPVAPTRASLSVAPAAQARTATPVSPAATLRVTPAVQARTATPVAPTRIGTDKVYPAAQARTATPVAPDHLAQSGGPQTVTVTAALAAAATPVAPAKVNLSVAPGALQSLAGFVAPAGVTRSVAPALVALTVSPVAPSSITRPLATSVARISLAAGSPPETRTNHVLYVRARCQSTGTGTLCLALYEGATDRSGPLTQAMTTTLTTYALAIPDVAAAAIGSYDDLEVRFWGQATSTIVFEIDQLWLEIPPAAPLVVPGWSRMRTALQAVNTAGRW